MRIYKMPLKSSLCVLSVKQLMVFLAFYVKSETGSSYMMQYQRKILLGWKYDDARKDRRVKYCQSKIIKAVSRLLCPLPSKSDAFKCSTFGVRVHRNAQLVGRRGTQTACDPA